MKRLALILALLCSAAALAAPVTPFQGGTGVSNANSKTITLGGLINTNGVAFASLPSAASNNKAIELVTDLGANGSYVRSNGTRWLALTGKSTLQTLGAQVSGVADTETIVMQTLLPINGWQTNDILRISLACSKSGTTDTLGLSIRIGTAGTTSDTAITGISATAFMSAPNRSCGAVFDIKLLAATSAQKLGVGSTAGGTYGASNATAVAAATTITSAAANALYVTVTIKSSSTNDTVGMEGGQIELITP